VVEGRPEVEALHAVGGPRCAFVRRFVDNDAGADGRDGVLNKVIGSMVEALVGAYRWVGAEGAK
jgi:hypothetical protein